MTDYTHYERNMSRDEMALRLNIETALREWCESECAKLKKELEDIKTAFKIKSDNLNRQSDEITKLRQDYDCAREKFTTEFNNVTYNYECALKENERLHKKAENQRIQLVGVQQALLDRNIKIEALTDENNNLKKEVKETRVVFEPSSYLRDIQAKDEEIKTLRKKNLDLKNENEGWKLKYDHLANEVEALKDALHDDEVEIHSLKAEKCLKETTKLDNPWDHSIDEYFENLRKENKTIADRLAELTAKDDITPIIIENLNVTYYANGPVWTDEEDKDDISGSDDQN